MQSTAADYAGASREYVQSLLQWRLAEILIDGLLIVEEPVAGEPEPHSEGFDSPPRTTGAPAGRPS